MTNRQPVTQPRSSHLFALAWAANADLIDRQLSPLGLAAMERLTLAPGAVVLDIGCGTGQTLLQLSDRVGPGGQVIGVDLAPLLLDVARQRSALLPQVHLIEADAQILPLPDASADAAFSRFGVMGFRDPEAAFSNLRRILRPGGALAFVCWRALTENELDHFPLAAAGLDAPVDQTPFSFADPDTIRCILTAAGFTQIAIAPHDEDVSSGGLDAMLQVLQNVGPLGRILREAPHLRALAAPRLRATLSARLAGRGDPATVHLRASVWIVTARAPI
jgi:SAM-dependent methyltransferase